MENRRRYNFRKCVICGTRKLPNSKIFLSSFPLDPVRCRSWVKAAGDEDLVHLPIEKLHELKFLCNSHFAPEFINEKGNRLLKSAVPTEKLTRPLLSDESLKEFPFHVRSFYEREQNKSVVLADITSISLNQSIGTYQSNAGHMTFPISATITSMAVENDVPTVGGERKVSTANELCAAGFDNIIPIPSTSSAPLHLTFKRKSEDASVQKDCEEILVQSYKRSRMTNSKTSDAEKAEKLTNREKLLLKRLQDTKITLKSIEKSYLDLDKLDSDVLKSIVESAVRNQKKTPQGKRYDLSTKISALAIFKRSPKAYRYMQKVLPLPSTRTLQRILKEIPMEPGIYPQIMQILKKMSQEMDDNDKHCVLLFDEMALKKRLIYNETMDKVEGFVDLGEKESMGRRNKIAGHALVFMIQGLKRKFKQPVAHYFVEGTVESEKLAVLIKDIVNAINENGFNIVSTVCDQGPTNIGALNLLKKNDGLAIEENYFFVNEKKVFILFDIPHLFKSIRNNFLQAGVMEFKGKTAKWCHLKEAEERNRNFLHFKNISPTVVNPTYKTKMRVKFAAQALSNTMAAVLKMMAWSSSNSDEINSTAFVIEEMDKLFDCTNGPASPKDVKKGIRENVSLKSKHEESWNYYLKYIDTIRFFKSNSKVQLRNVRCIKGFQITLKSLKDIWHFLNKKANLKYLNLRQLNQDSLENLFGNIRQHSATNRNPTCSHFNAALKSSIISGLSGPHSRGSNCEVDYNKLFISYEELKQKPELELTTLSQNVEFMNETNVCYPVLSLPEDFEIEQFESSLCSFEEQPVVYVSGYLAAKVLTKFNCKCCTMFLKEENPNLEDPLYKFISLKEWWNEKISLTYPKKELCNLVNHAKNIYEEFVAPNIHHTHISQFCILQLSSHCNMTWFKCEAHCKDVMEYFFYIISKLFIRRSCKIINSDFVMCEADVADKVKKAQQQNKDK